MHTRFFLSVLSLKNPLKKPFRTRCSERLSKKNLFPLLSEQQTTLSLIHDNDGKNAVRILPPLLCSECVGKYPKFHNFNKLTFIVKNVKQMGL
jgi:hypothetical protein